MAKNYLYQLNELNKIFCTGACEIVIQWKKGWIRNVGYVPGLNVDYAIYRSIRNVNGSSFFVADVDTQGDLELGLNVVLSIYYLSGRKGLVKFSGKKGFHFTQLVNPESRTWKAHAKEREAFLDLQSYFKATLEGMSQLINRTTTDEKIARENNLACLDPRMFDNRRIIRGLSPHLETGYFSVPVFPEEDTLEDILKRSRLESPMGIDDVVIPEFNLFGLARLSTEDKHSILRRESSSKNGPVEEKTHLPAFRLGDNDNVPTCIKRLLNKRGGNPTHPERFFLVSWLKRRGRSKDEILELIGDLEWQDYDPHVTKTQVDQIIKKDYLPDGLLSRISKGICSLPGQCRKCVMNSVCGGGEHDEH